MRVGVAMAVYEPDEGYLGQQVESMRAQVGVTWRAHVVDDASSQQSFERTRALLDGDDRFVLHRSPVNLGSVGAFGAALEHVAGESVDAVALADQDDVWHPQRLAATAAALGPEVAAVHSDLRLIDGEGAVLADSVWHRERRWTTTDLRRTVFRNSVTGCALTVRQTCRPRPASSDRPRPAAYHHDAWLTLHALRLGAVQGLERPLVDYRAHGSNVVGVAPTGLVSALQRRRQSLVSSLHDSVAGKRALAEDLLDRVRARPLRPDEYDDVARSVGLFVGSGSLSDHRALLAQTRGNADLTRRLAQWYAGLAVGRLGLHPVP